MSPSEAQLRAALHHGEGDSPDAGALISHAVRVRRARQRRVTSIVTGTTVVAVVAAGVGLLVSLGTGSESGGGGTSARPAAGGAAGAALHGTAPAAAPTVVKSDGAGSGNGAGRFATAEKAPARAMRIICPPTPERYMLPGGGGIGAYGSTEKLFVRSVLAMKICAYPKIPGRTPVSTVLTAADAHHFANALESAPATTISPRSCPANAFLGSTLEVRAVSGNARPLKPVVITIGPCYSSQATNGTAVRYLATLPRPVAKLLSTAARLSPAPSKPRNGSAPS